MTAESLKETNKKTLRRELSMLTGMHGTLCMHSCRRKQTPQHAELRTQCKIATAKVSIPAYISHHSLLPAFAPKLTALASWSMGDAARASAVICKGRLRLPPLPAEVFRQQHLFSPVVHLRQGPGTANDIPCFCLPAAALLLAATCSINS